MSRSRPRCRPPTSSSTGRSPTSTSGWLRLSGKIRAGKKTLKPEPNLIQDKNLVFGLPMQLCRRLKLWFYSFSCFTTNILWSWTYTSKQLWAGRIGEASAILTENRDQDFFSSRSRFCIEIGESRDWPRLSSNCLRNFESRGGLPDLNLDFSKSRGGLPDLDLDPTRPDICRDIIPLKISRP